MLDWMMAAAAAAVAAVAVAITVGVVVTVTAAVDAVTVWGILIADSWYYTYARRSSSSGFVFMSHMYDIF